jgi:hypothetical protein
MSVHCGYQYNTWLVILEKAYSSHENIWKWLNKAKILVPICIRVLKSAQALSSVPHK